MHADAAFAIGKSHSVCQDYALAGVTGGLAYAVLSDGCSGSPDTDIGARIIARSCVKAIKERDYRAVSDVGIALDTLRYAHEMARGWEMPLRCCDATCLAASSDGLTVKVFVYGDGWVFAERLDGSLLLWHYSYITDRPNVSLPIYLSYRWDDFDRAAIMANYGISRWDLVIDAYQVSPDAGIIWHEATWRSAELVNPGYLTLAADGLRLVGVMSDGADSFMGTIHSATTRRTEDVPFERLMTRIPFLRFPNVDGRFVQARINRIAKDCAREEIFHADDLSMAVITFPEGGE
jgi:hypothetical protein